MLQIRKQTNSKWKLQNMQPIHQENTELLHSHRSYESSDSQERVKFLSSVRKKTNFLKKSSVFKKPI